MALLPSPAGAVPRDQTFPKAITVVEVFAFQDRQNWSAPPGVEIRFYALNPPLLLEQRLARQLAPTATTSVEFLRARVEQLVATEDRRALKRAVEGLMLARRRGVDRLPAMVFDQGRAVVYGTLDLSLALEHYRNWRP